MKTRSDTKDTRPNSRRRRALRKILLTESGSVPCVHCGVDLDSRTLTMDRIVPGGSYTLSNLQPSCLPCNSSRGNKLDWKGRKNTKKKEEIIVIEEQKHMKTLDLSLKAWHIWALAAAGCAATVGLAVWSELFADYAEKLSPLQIVSPALFVIAVLVVGCVMLIVLVEYETRKKRK